jgi:glycosyltransferase involved in cell wall biosynthesis
MRICIASQEYPPETAAGGIGTQAFAKANALAARGHEVTVVSASKAGRRTTASLGGVNVIRTSAFYEQMILATDAAQWITYSAAVAAEVAALKPDLVEFPEWGGEAYVHLLNQTEWNHIPTVVQIHGPLVMFANEVGWPEPESDLFRLGSLMERTSLEKADGVYSSSAYSAQICREAYGLCRPIPILHVGVDTEHFAPRAIPKSPRPTIVFAGRIHPDKGVDTLFEAGCLLERQIPDLQLQFIGRGSPSYVDDLRRRAQERGVNGLLQLAGYVGYDDLPAYFSAAHVFAAPSVNEGGPGFVFLEAMSCGLPAIACRETGASEAIIHGQTGYLVGKNDVAELVSALGSVLSEETLRRNLGNQAREHVIGSASRPSCMARIEAFYQEFTR